MKLKLRSKSKSKVYPSQAKTFRKSLQEGGLSGILEKPVIVDSVCEKQIEKDIESNLPFFRLEDQKFLDELLLKQYPEYVIDLNGFELVDMYFEDSKSGKFQLGNESFEYLQARTSDEQTPSEMNSAETLVPVDFVDMWENECSEDIKEVQEIEVEVEEIVVEKKDIVVKDQRTSDQIGISWAINRANQLAQLKPKVHKWEAKKTTNYSDPTNRTKIADQEPKLAWIVPKRRNCKKPYTNQSSDRNIHANSHKSEDNDSFGFGFLMSNKY